MEETRLAQNRVQLRREVQLRNTFTETEAGGESRDGTNEDRKLVEGDVCPRGVSI